MVTRPKFDGLPGDVFFSWGMGCPLGKSCGERSHEVVHAEDIGKEERH